MAFARTPNICFEHNRTGGKAPIFLLGGSRKPRRIDWIEFRPELLMHSNRQSHVLYDGCFDSAIMYYILRSHEDLGAIDIHEARASTPKLSQDTSVYIYCSKVPEWLHLLAQTGIVTEHTYHTVTTSPFGQKLRSSNPVTSPIIFQEMFHFKVS